VNGLLVDMIAPNGTAVVVTDYTMRNHMTGWTKHPRHIDWSVIVRRWAGSTNHR